MCELGACLVGQHANIDHDGAVTTALDQRLDACRMLALGVERAKDRDMFAVIRHVSGRPIGV
jgi:hypothetical protein